MSSPPLILTTSAAVSSLMLPSSPYSCIRKSRSRRAVALRSMPDSAAWRTTDVRLHHLTPPNASMTSWESAGEESSPTGGSWAASPSSTMRQSAPLRTKVTRSSRRLPVPNTALPLPEGASVPSAPISETSSTTKRVSRALFGAREKLPQPSALTDFWR